ncbi:tRNA pseudouridine(38-40) synthase TruA [Endomicrobium proavitum]|uniref:tRNA pseudouridine synthase A n=1 Tax=Endomicrobium proavitum TaxID=1408281 RepID=A0A0G3WGT5_9BACT|nr:tRNA pseudouridine(38-40) synthase TruA [Endomicrobium proavitum]AKL97886.1 tRNA pseudouridine synthase A [Endomicrobium proavitum]
MPNFQLIIEYNGTNFNGWGKQPRLRTVCGELEKAFFAIFKTPVNITCAGRTDKGVHATGQCANIRLPDEILPEKLLLRLNSLLPTDINVKIVKAVNDCFDARKSAKSKTYTYIIYNSPIRSALQENRSWHVAQPLDIKLMKTAAKFLQAKRDCSAFDSYNSVFDYKIVDLQHVSISKNGNFITISVTADHFLYKMVRKMVGEIVKIGKKELPLAEFKSTVLSKNCSKSTKPAPPHGLYLTKVSY